MKMNYANKIKIRIHSVQETRNSTQKMKLRNGRISGTEKTVFIKNMQFGRGNYYANILKPTYSLTWIILKAFITRWSILNT